MQTRVEWQTFRRYVVRLDKEGQGPIGTGFLLAPGWVLTCAHVAAKAEGKHLSISWNGVQIPAEIVGTWPEDPGNTELWAFPDLALVKLLANVDHPFVLVGPADPLSDEICHAWGYPRKLDGVDPTGAPATFTFEGPDGDGFLQLKGGQAKRGLSGAPLISRSRRAVVGIVTASRNPETDLGGWATPLSALFDIAHGSSDLANIVEMVLEANHQGHLVERSWQRVLPVPECEAVLDQPWAEFTKSSRSTPADLLRADFGVVPYLFRDRLIQDLVDWCAQPEPLAIWQVTGKGGTGKTRFAIQACRKLAQEGWATGFVPKGVTGIADCSLPRLLVVDYAENRDIGTLRDLLDGLRRKSASHSPARVLLLVRSELPSPADLWGALGERAALKTVIDAREETEAGWLDPDQRTQLYAVALKKFSNNWRVQPPSDIVPPDLSEPKYATPLEVLVEALACVLSVDRPAAPGGEGAFDTVLRHEARYWSESPLCPTTDTRLQRCCVALATLAGACDQGEAERLLRIIPELQNVPSASLNPFLTWLRSLYPSGHGFLNPLEPDRLGEALVVRSLADNDGSGLVLLAGVLSLPADEQLIRCMEVLNRIAASTKDLAVTVGSLLGHQHQVLVTRAERYARGSPDRPGRTIFAAHLSTLMLAAPIAEALAAGEPGNTTFQRDLAISYERLGDLARESGQGEEAERLYRRSLAIREALAAGEPGNTTFQRDLAISYERLGDLARESGQGEEAERLLIQAVAIRDGLFSREAKRVDLGEELGVALLLLARVIGDDRRVLRRRVIEVLSPFEEQGLMTSKGASLLRWARSGTES